MKLLPFPIEEGLHVVKVKIRRRPVIPGVFGKEDRRRSPACDADQMGMKSLGGDRRLCRRGTRSSASTSTCTIRVA